MPYLEDVNLAHRLVKDIRYHFLDRSNTSSLYPYTMTLHPNARKVLEEVISVLEDKGDIEVCPECKGALRYGFSIDGTGEVGLANCHTCDARGVVPRGTKPNPLDEKAYYRIAYKRVMGRDP